MTAQQSRKYTKKNIFSFFLTPVLNVIILTEYFDYRQRIANPLPRVVD